METSFNQIIDLLNKHLGTRATAVYLQNPIKNYVHRTLADISLASKELGYKPKWSINDGIKRLIELNEKSQLVATKKA